jgi:hypothetical protein
MNDPLAPPPAPAVPPFDAGRAAVFAIGIGVPLVAGLAWAGPIAGLFAAVGALNALFTDPRRGFAPRLLAIAAAIALLLLSAWLGASFTAHPHAALALGVVLALPAGLVPMTFPYLSIVARLVPLVVIVVATTPLPAGHVLGGYIAGTVFATLATLVEALFRPAAAGSQPVEELRRMWRGDRNGIDYAVAYAGALALALAAAYGFSATRPFWAAVAVLFVMHPDRGEAMTRIGRRIGGTFAGVAAAWVIVAAAPSGWIVAFAAVAAAAAIPWSMGRGVFASTTSTTLFVLLVLDLGLGLHGQDRPLLEARLVDTLIGTAAVAIATVALDGWRRAWATSAGDA